MSRSDELLQQFQQHMVRWARPIRNGTGATDLVFSVVPGDGFTLRVVWKNGGEYVRHYSKVFIFGQGYDEMSCSIKKRACDYARDFMREVLAQRGAI